MRQGGLTLERNADDVRGELSALAYHPRFSAGGEAAKTREAK